MILSALVAHPNRCRRLHGSLAFWMRAPLFHHCNSFFAKEKKMVRTLTLILVRGVIVLVSLRRLDAQTTNLTDAVQPLSQPAADSGIQHIIWVWFEIRESTAITAAP